MRAAAGLGATHDHVGYRATLIAREIAESHEVMTVHRHRDAPLLDFFRRGEVARDVRMAAAQGAIAPRPLEQLGLLMILSGDPDSEVRMTAEATLGLLPTELIAGFIARSDVPTELREFFIKRGIDPSATPAPDRDEVLLDTSESEIGTEAVGGEDDLSFTQRLAKMTVPEKVKCAMKGTREMRSILMPIRKPGAFACRGRPWRNA